MTSHRRRILILGGTTEARLLAGRLAAEGHEVTVSLAGRVKEIVPHPVFTDAFKRDDWWLWPGSSSLLISEYTKYLVALARSPFDRLIARLSEDEGA